MRKRRRWWRSMSGASASRSPRASRCMSSRSDGSVTPARLPRYRHRRLLEPDEHLLAVLFLDLDQRAPPRPLQLAQREPAAQRARDAVALLVVRPVAAALRLVRALAGGPHRHRDADQLEM